VHANKIVCAFAFSILKLNIITMTFNKNIFASFRRDATAGTITGLMAIPLSVGICLMSEYPVQTGLITVFAACIISFITYLFRPGNHVDVPGIAAGLAPALAMGIHTFGMENMPFLIFLTAIIQGLVWKFNLQKYMLKSVPNYLVEGLLAGIGLKIALKILPFTYLTYSDHQHANFTLDTGHELIMGLSLISFVLFIFLFKKYGKKSPSIPYVVTIVLGILCSFAIQLPQLDLDKVPFAFKLPIPNIASITPMLGLKMLGFALMLATIDVIEQVMSNAALEKLDPLDRPCDTNNSLLAIWMSNLVSSFFGGMTNLDGLAKSTTNATAGAQTKLSNIFTAIVIGVVIAFPKLLSYLPEFSLGVIMIFSGWKMINGLRHVIHQGKYAFMLAVFCGVLVFKLGIFEGLILALVLHAIITFFFLRHDDVSMIDMWYNIKNKFAGDDAAIVSAMNAEVVTVDIKTYPIVQEWMQYINQHALDKITNLYDDKAVLLPTLSDQIRDSKEKIKDYFIHFFKQEDLAVKMENCIVNQYGDVRLNIGTYEFSWIENFEPQIVRARFTFAIRNNKIIEHHSSLMPN
jgi:MFS superfamily sulfate permease-like transporter